MLVLIMLKTIARLTDSIAATALASSSKGVMLTRSSASVLWRACFMSMLALPVALAKGALTAISALSLRVAPGAGTRL